jgi:hypothetical protein
VWPSFWTYGLQREWPNAGEIDIIEGINGMDANQIALHALPGCMKTELPGQQTGLTLERNCSTVKGCIVKETKANSYGAAFARAGGGAYATQFAPSGIYIWFWSVSLPEYNFCNDIIFFRGLTSLQTSKMRLLPQKWIRAVGELLLRRTRRPHVTFHTIFLHRTWFW